MYTHNAITMIKLVNIYQLLPNVPCICLYFFFFFFFLCVIRVPNRRASPLLIFKHIVLLIICTYIYPDMQISITYSSCILKLHTCWTTIPIFPSFLPLATSLSILCFYECDCFRNIILVKSYRFVLLELI